MPDRGIDEAETDVFAPDPVELELWSDEVARAREEYYTSPGPHRESWRERRLESRYSVPRWFPAGSARTVLEEALRDLQAERHRGGTMRRMITRLQRRVIELEILTGERDAEGNPLQSMRRADQDDEPAGDGLLFAALRGQSEERGTKGKATWKA